MMRALWSLGLACGAPVAQAIEPFVVEQVSAHVWTAHPQRTVRVSATSTVIVGEQGLTVVESQADPELARQLIRDIRTRISKKPVHTLIFTHAHLDHILGAEAFVAAYPGVRLVAHANTRTAVLEGGEKERQEWLGFLRSSVERLPPTNDQHPQLLQYIDAVSGARILAPTQTFTHAATLHDGLEIRLQYVGRGHTDGDLVVHIPAEGVLVTGDLAHGLEPLFQSSYPREWIAAVKKLLELPFEVFVGGHGDPQRDRETMRQWLRYMEMLVSEVQTAKLRGETQEQARAHIEADFVRWLAQDGNDQRIQSQREALMREWLIGTLNDAARYGVDMLWRRL